MATIHRTTMTPGKLEMLAAWLPTRPWYRGSGSPAPARAGGFRLDDPHGEVGIEFVFVRDEQGDEPVCYQVPVTYRGAVLEGAQDALIATAEHGVLGRRWIYDATADHVFLDRLCALLGGTAVAQAQSRSDTVERAVSVQATTIPGLRPSGRARDEGEDTVLPVRTGDTERLLCLHRVLGAAVPGGTRVLAPVYGGSDAAGQAAGDAVLLPVVTLC